jgi:hypothetical protein
VSQDKPQPGSGNVIIINSSDNDSNAEFGAFFRHVMGIIFSKYHHKRDNGIP